VGGGWLIFGLPAAEMVPPSDEGHRLQHAGHRLLGAVLYLMCEDLQLLIKTLEQKGVSYAEVEEEDCGIRTTIRLPSGGELGLYQPTHEIALGLKA